MLSVAACLLAANLPLDLMCVCQPNRSSSKLSAILSQTLPAGHVYGRLLGRGRPAHRLLDLPPQFRAAGEPYTVKRNTR